MLQTEGVVLTAVEPEDIPLIVLWRNMPEVYTGFIEHAPLSTAAQAAFQAGLTPEELAVFGLSMPAGAL